MMPRLTYPAASRASEAARRGALGAGLSGAGGPVGSAASLSPASGAPSPRLLRVQHLDLGQRAANLLGRLAIQQADNRPNRLDPHPRLLEVALVLLGDPPGSEVEHADNALQQQVLDADRAELLLDPRAELLLALRRLLALGRWGWTLGFGHRR